MNKPKHTPGKWYYDEETQTVRAPAVMGDGHWFTVATCDRKRDNCNVNAQLMAAAPTLYKACEKALSLLCDIGYENDTGTVDFKCAMDTISTLKNAIEEVK